MIKVVCAWCGKHLRNVEDKQEGTSHGIWPACFAVQMAEVKIKQKQGDTHAHRQ